MPATFHHLVALFFALLGPLAFAPAEPLAQPPPPAVAAAPSGRVEIAQIWRLTGLTNDQRLQIVPLLANPNSIVDAERVIGAEAIAEAARVPAIASEIGR